MEKNKCIGFKVEKNNFGKPDIIYNCIKNNREWNVKNCDYCQNKVNNCNYQSEIGYNDNYLINEVYDLGLK